MLQELIHAAKNGNNVIFSTHSGFMIDRDNYNRYAIVKKSAEKSSIRPSNDDRMGYFLQEEVLYSSLDISLDREISSTRLKNFVFEGTGDAILFRRYLELAQSPPNPAIASFGFFQGGKCTDIRKYLNQRPLQLGSTWVFVLDNDRPAQELVAAIRSRYGAFEGGYVHIFQYEAELEDLLPFAYVLATAGEVLPEDQESREQILGTKREESTPAKAWLSAVAAAPGVPADFLARFKTRLNHRLRNDSEGFHKLHDFEQAFPAYFKWVASAAETLESVLADPASKKAKKAVTPRPS